MFRQSSPPSTNDTPYGSVRDLPSFRELEQQLSAMKLLTYFIGRRYRHKLVESELQMERLATTVDNFYERLGPRHWIFHDSLNVSTVEELLNQTADAASAEARLIEVYRDKDASMYWIRRLRNVAGLRERFNQIVRAREHYDADQFDSCTLHLLAIMDGFVNDVEPQTRKALSSRNVNEMVAWDHVVGHYLGLTNALRSFTKTIKRRVDEPVFELHRHGIVHGSLTDYDNVVVATKAWNMLYAVVDWAAATEEMRKPVEPTPSWRDAIQRHQKNLRLRTQLDAWCPKSFSPGFDGFQQHGIFKLTFAFLSAWQDSNFGTLARFVDHRSSAKMTPGRAAGEMRARFEYCRLGEFEITKLENAALVIWIARGTANQNGRPGTFECRWTRGIESGDLDADFDPSTWRLVFCSPSVWQPSEETQS